LGKGGTILGLIGLILGVGGIAFGGFAWLTVSNLESQVVNFGIPTTWYKENHTNFNSNPTNTYLTFSGLTIEFELGLNESIYFSFIAWAHIEPIPNPIWSNIKIYFRVDGIIDTDQFAEVGTYIGDESVHFMIPLHDIRQDLSEGVHNVTVAVYGSSTANYISDSSLIVQKLAN
jgi:hypothetical protein